MPPPTHRHSFAQLVLPLSGFGYEAPVSVPDKLTELVPMEDILNLNVLGGDMNVKVGRALRIHCLDDDGVGMKNQRVDVAIKNVLILDPAGTLDCNTATQELLRDTIEGENMREACRPHLSASPPVPSFVPAEDVVPGPATAHSNYTDELGIVIYQTLEARSGPPGLYELNISATGGGVTADKVVSVQVTTNVSRILIDETNQVGMAPYTVEIGQPIRTRTGATPVVYVQDSKGSPVTGRRVVAFAHHSDNFFRRDTYLDGAQEPEYHYHVGSGQKETVRFAFGRLLGGAPPDRRPPSFWCLVKFCIFVVTCSVLTRFFYLPPPTPPHTMRTHVLLPPLPQTSLHATDPVRPHLRDVQHTRCCGFSGSSDHSCCVPGRLHHVLLRRPHSVVDESTGEGNVSGGVLQRPSDLLPSDLRQHCRLASHGAGRPTFRKRHRRGAVVPSGPAADHYRQGRTGEPPGEQEGDRCPRHPRKHITQRAHQSHTQPARQLM